MTFPSCPITGESMLHPGQTIGDTAVTQFRIHAKKLCVIMSAVDWVLSHPQTQSGGARTIPTSKPPINVGLLDLADEHRDTIDAWTAALATWRHQPHQPGNWPLTQAQLTIDPKQAPLRNYPQAPDLVTACTHALSRLQKLTEPQAATLFAGPCPNCETELVATPGQAYIQCPECDQWVDVQKNRHKMIQTAEERILPRQDARREAEALLGIDINQSTLKSWIRRGNITNHNGWYRVGDLVAAATATM